MLICSLAWATAACENRSVHSDGKTSGAPGDGLVYSAEKVGDREDGSGAFRTHCLESHENFDDPLVFPGQPGASHHHVFFGNPNVDAYTTIGSLFEATETTCDGGTLNRSAYWIPALYDANEKRIDYGEPLFYYKTGYHVAAAAIQPPPENLRIIAGNAHATTSQDVSVVKFRCGSWVSEKDWFDPGDPLDHVSILPDCPKDDFLEIRIVFPQCWDGKNLYLPDQSHMAYPSEATPPVVGTGACPQTHPIAIPEISYNFRLYVTEDRGPSNSWRFACETNPGGICAHADWMNGWDPKTMEKIVENCLRPARECLVGLLGDGTRLDPVITD
ncbi:DUF1996 domain-containing protein [Rhodohalobacter sulfatireducens]|nr:DUF1996 domain-containing protein [Rhodohalobacter sulfatireducens]